MHKKYIADYFDMNIYGTAILRLVVVVRRKGWGGWGGLGDHRSLCRLLLLPAPLDNPLHDDYKEECAKGLRACLIA